jgi:hypothetical protein
VLLSTLALTVASGFCVAAPNVPVFAVGRFLIGFVEHPTRE